MCIDDGRVYQMHQYTRFFFFFWFVDILKSEWTHSLRRKQWEWYLKFLFIYFYISTKYEANQNEASLFMFSKWLFFIYVLFFFQVSIK